MDEVIWNDFVCNLPNGTRGIYYVYIVAFDSTMVSAPYLLQINVTDSSYSNDNLINQTVKVGRGPNIVYYKLPPAANKYQARSLPQEL